jgi:hypothetical protein
VRLVLATGEAFEIGPAPMLLGSSAVCIIHVTGAAPQHARIEGDDIEAIAPCHVGGVALSPGERRRLVPGVAIELGEGRLSIDTAEGGPSADDFTTRELALRAVAEPKRLWPTVIVVQGKNAGAEVVLREEGTFLVGRSTTSSLALEDVDVSREHLAIVRRGDAVLLRDLGSTRGTFLGHAKLDPQRKALWTPELMVKVGRTVLALVSPTWAPPPSHPKGATVAASATPSHSPARSPSPEHEAPALSVNFPPSSAGAIAEVPMAEPPPTAAPLEQRPSALDRAFVVAMLTLVGLAVMGLVWVLWP